MYGEDGWLEASYEDRNGEDGWLEASYEDRESQFQPDNYWDYSDLDDEDEDNE